ncbi:MAG: hypothetical protein QOG83_2413 [Alphaproteobacteria bacterium]|nr:hypothetical protein [Alphaproteobacteria bacterium]
MEDEKAERRQVRRTRVLRNAKIILSHRYSIIHCTLHNLTSHGACLALGSTYRVPDSFELTFEHGRSRRPCRVIWRTSSRLGVCFDEPAEPEPAPAN